MLRPRLLAPVAVAATVLSTVAAVSAPAAAAAPPPSVRQLAASVQGAAIQLSWADPKKSRFDSVVVRYRRGATAPKYGAGRQVPIAHARAAKAKLTRLAANTRYTAAVWTRSGRRRSAPTTTTFTTEPAAVSKGHVIGKVTDTAGHPLRNALVVAAGPFGGYHSTRSGANGTFRLSVPGDTGYGYEYAVDGTDALGGDSDSTGYVGTEGGLVKVANGAVRNLGSVALADGAAVVGRVTDASGKPLAGVHPYFAPNYPYVADDLGGIASISVSTGLGLDRTVTGHDGSFRLTGLPAGSLQICFDSTIRRVTGGDPASAGYAQSCALDSIDPLPGSTTDIGGTELAAVRTGSAVVHVVGPNGHGLRGVDLALISLSTENEADVITDATGRHRFDGLRPGRYHVCADVLFQPPRSSGYQSSCFETSVRISAGQTAHKTVRLARGAALAGRVTATNGRPVPGATLDLRGKDGDYAGAVTDPHGHYVARGVAPGTYRVCFLPSSSGSRQLPTGTTQKCASHRLTLTAGTIRIGGDARLSIGGAISGTVTDTNGAPVHEAAVFARPTSGRRAENIVETDVHGRYLLASLRPGTYRLCFLSVDNDAQIKCPRKHVRVRRGVTVAPVDVSLPAMARIEVTVRDEQGHPLAGADVVGLVACRDSDLGCSKPPLFGKRAGIGGSVMTNKHGKASLDDLKPGKYAVCVFGFYAASPAGTAPTGYADKCLSATFDVTATRATPVTLTTTLSVAGAVSGSLSDLSSAPVSGIRVHVTGSAADDYSNAGWIVGGDTPKLHSRSGSDGTFLVRSVQAGDQTVCFQVPSPKGGYKNDCLDDPVTVTSGTTTDVGDTTIDPAR